MLLLLLKVRTHLQVSFAAVPLLIPANQHASLNNSHTQLLPALFCANHAATTASITAAAAASALICQQSCCQQYAQRATQHHDIILIGCSTLQQTSANGKHSTPLAAGYACNSLHLGQHVTTVKSASTLDFCTASSRQSTAFVPTVPGCKPLRICHRPQL
jgi:hypothetical protein